MYYSLTPTKRQCTSDNPIKNKMILITFLSATLKNNFKVKGQFYVRWRGLGYDFSFIFVHLRMSIFSTSSLHIGKMKPSPLQFL